MKFLCLLSTLIFINCINILKSEEIKLINKFDDENFVDIYGSFSYQIGDSIFFYANTCNEDSTKFTLRMLCYYENKFVEIADESLIKGQANIRGWLSGFVIDSKNNAWFSLSDGGLFRFSPNGELKIYNSMLMDNNIDMINSIVLDDKDNLLMQVRNRIFMFDGVKIELKFDSNENRYFIPSPNTFDNFMKIDNRIYFKSFNSTLAYYDLLEEKADTVNYNSNLISYDQKLNNLFLANNNIYLTYLQNDEIHFAKFDGDKLTNLDYLLEKFNYGEPVKNYLNLAIDKSSRFYLKHKTSLDNPKGDTIYIIDKDLNVKKLLYKHLVNNNGIGFTNAFQISEDKVILPIGGGSSLFQISKTTDVNTPKNLIFFSNLYPNPARDMFNIDFGIEPVNIGNMKVEMFDYLGRSAGVLNPEIMYDSSTGKGTMVCNVENLQKGLYIISLSNGKYHKAMTVFLN